MPGTQSARGLRPHLPPTCSNTCRARPLQFARALAMRTGMRGGNAPGSAREAAVAAAAAVAAVAAARGCSARPPRPVRGGAAQVSGITAARRPPSPDSPRMLLFSSSVPPGNFGVVPASGNAV